MTALLTVTLAAALSLGTPERLTRVGDDHAHWAPDGKAFVFSSNRDGKWHVWRAAADGSAVTRLTAHAADDDTPTWAPTGDLIAFESSQSGDREIWVMASDGSGARNLSRSPGVDMHPHWSKDGQRILFNSNRDDDKGFALYTMRRDGSEVRRLTGLDAMRTYASWSPDGQRLVFVKWSGGEKSQGDIWVADADGRNERALVTDPAFDGWPSWAPDSRAVVFSSDRSGRHQLYLASLDGGAPLRLLESDGDDRRAYFTPDGTRLSFDRAKDRSAAILIAPVTRAP